MQDFFPGSLVTCIRDGRLPLPDELANVGAKLWQEGLVHRSPARPELARILAEIALSGDPELIDASEQPVNSTRAEVLHYERPQVVSD